MLVESAGLVLAAKHVVEGARLLAVQFAGGRSSRPRLLNPGNSGGPVIDESGQLLGVAIAGSDPRRGAQGIGVAVRLEQIRQSLGAVRQGRLRPARRSGTR